MTKGVVAQLPELIALQRQVYVGRVSTPSQAQRTGVYLSKWHGRGMDFSEVRNYQAGDEIRHMDWRVTARTGEPHIKLYQEERERPVIIMVDFNPSMYFGTRIAFKSVIAARLAALIAWTVVKQRDRIGALIFSANTHHEFSPRSRYSGVLPILEGLSQYTQANIKSISYEQPGRPVSEILQRLRRVVKPGSVLVMISDFYHLDKESEQHLNQIASHNNVLAYHLCDPLELSPPKPQQYMVTNGQQDIFLDTTNRSVRDAYTLHCEEHMISLQTQLKGLRIQYAQVTAANDLSLLVRQTFPRRAYV